MSIKEALGRGPIERERTIVKRYKEPNPELVEVSRSLLKASGAQTGLDELVDIIRPEFPDVEVNEHILPDSSLIVTIDWNRRSTQEPKLSDRYHYNSIAVRTDPITEELVISSEEEDEILQEFEWYSDSEIVEDAIVRAYQNPMKMIGPLARL